MKFLFLFLFPFFLTDSGQLDSPNDQCKVESDAGAIRICWKGPKGKKTCIMISQSGLRSDEDIDADAFLSAQGAMILRISDSRISSFQIAESTTIEGCGANVNVRKGTNVDVINGLAFIE